MDAPPILGSSLDDLRRTRSSAKWAAFGPDVLPVWVAEMDSAPCPAVVDAVTATVGRGDTGYTWPREFGCAVSEFAQERWNWTIDPKRGMCLPDVVIALQELIRRHVPLEGAVVVSPPCYDAFYSVADAVERRTVTAHLGADLRLDLEALERAFVDAGAGSAYILCNPQNPTGTVHTAAELAALAQLADAHQILVISDEIHAPLVQPGTTFTPYLTVPEAARGVALVSASKAWNLAGLKSAFAVAGDDAQHRLTDLHPVITHGANYVAVIAQTAAFTEGGAWLDQLLVELADRRRLLTELLAQHLPQVRVVPADATYLAWLDCRALGLADPAAVFRGRGKVALSPGKAYDHDQGAGWARFNFATSPEVITEAVRRMASALD